MPAAPPLAAGSKQWLTTRKPLKQKESDHQRLRQSEFIRSFGAHSISL
jgi:hypothetical protein